MAPTTSSCFNIGTDRKVRAPASSTIATILDRGRGIPASSSCRQIAPPVLSCACALLRFSGPGKITGLRRRNSAYSAGAPCRAPVRKLSPSQSKSVPNLASQRRVAFASMASNTGSSSPGELEMICSTSEVAVCCSSASLSSAVRACTSSNSRTFSIAITAWSAKIVTSSICFSENGRTVFLTSEITPIGFPSRRSGTPRTVRKPALLAGFPSSYIPGPRERRPHERFSRPASFARRRFLVLAGAQRL